VWVSQCVGEQKAIERKSVIENERERVIESLSEGASIRFFLAVYAVCALLSAPRWVCGESGCASVCARTHMCVNAFFFCVCSEYKYVQTHVNVYIYVYIYICIHIYIHTGIYIYV